MLNMPQIERIRDLAAAGRRPSEIREETGTSYPTIRKYLAKDDFSEPAPARAERPSVLDPYKPAIDAMLAEDRGTWRKQRHTARRIFDRLVAEEGYEGGYSTVQRYVKALRGSCPGRGQYNDLKWRPGDAQVDFGEADVDLPAGGRARLDFQCIVTPNSNDGWIQMFASEEAVAVCQGLKAWFEHVGGVPPYIVFDNATGAGRRVGDAIHEAGLFRRFRMHYGFVAAFTNPYAGYEKGSVENKVGFSRRNLLVPVPVVGDVAEFNRELAGRCDELARVTAHYERGSTWREIFDAEDRPRLLPLPAAPFDVVDWKVLPADKYGRVNVGRGHEYLAGPDLAGCEVVAGIRALEVELRTVGGEAIRTYRRNLAAGPTRDDDPLALLPLLARKPGAFRNSPVREMLGDATLAHLDSLAARDLREQLSRLTAIAASSGFEVAAAAFEETLSATGGLAASDVAFAAAGVAAAGRPAPEPPGAKLIGYDEFLRATGGDSHAKEAL